MMNELGTQGIRGLRLTVRLRKMWRPMLTVEIQADRGLHSYQVSARQDLRRVDVKLEVSRFDTCNSRLTRNTYQTWTVAQAVWDNCLKHRRTLSEERNLAPVPYDSISSRRGSTEILY